MGRKRRISASSRKYRGPRKPSSPRRGSRAVSYTHLDVYKRQAIKTATDELTQAFYAVSEKLYAQANPQGAQGGSQTGPEADAQGAAGGQYYDADYKVVDEDENKDK